MAAAGPSPTGELEMDSTGRQAIEDYYTEDTDGESRTDGGTLSSMRDKEKKIGHRRVDKSGIVSYKKKPTSELMAAIQLGIGQSVGGLSSKPERDVLMQDFGVVEVVFFPGEGSNLTPAHHYSDFRFKTYAPVAFRYFRDLFGIQPEDFMLSLCNEPLKELSNPGASGSIFYLTHDDEFIIKTVQHKEAEFLQKLLPGYFLNISQNKRTLLPKFYGLYCYQCGGKNIRFTVMNNLLPSTVQLHEKYDMKGSTYKRKASKSERAKKAPTLKDLDFMEIHPECLQLEKDIYDSLIKTLQRDCRVLESFKIMDYSLLVGIYNLDQLNRENRPCSGGSDAREAKSLCNIDSEAVCETTGGTTTGGLHRAKSMRTRIGQYSTPLESIQGNMDTDLRDDMEDDEDVPLEVENHLPDWLSTNHVDASPGGIPGRNAKGERILLYLGIIDILQSFRLKKRLEHTVKSMVIDGDTISVHRPSYYAQRFLQFHASQVFKKVSTALKHSPSKRRALNKSTKQTPGQSEVPEQHSISHSNPRSSRTISFSDEQNGPDEVGGKPPDLLPEYSKSAKRSPRLHRDRGGANVNGNSSHQKRSDAFTMSTYPSEDALSAGTASTASLRAIGVGSGYPSSSSGRGPSPPLSLSESTPTHTDFTEGTPSFTNSSPSCSSDVMVTNKKTVVTFCTPPPTYPTTTPAAITTTTPLAAIATVTSTPAPSTAAATSSSSAATESHVTFKLPPSSSGLDDGDDHDGARVHSQHRNKDEKDKEEYMGGVSPLENMDSPTTSHSLHHHHHHRSPDLHQHKVKMMHSGKTASAGTGGSSRSSGLGVDMSPTRQYNQYPASSPTKQQMAEVTVTVIPESPPPPFEAVVGEDDDGPEPTTTTTSSPQRQQSTTTTTYGRHQDHEIIFSTEITTKTITKNGDDGEDEKETRASATPAIVNAAEVVGDVVEEAQAADEDEMTRL